MVREGYSLLLNRRGYLKVTALDSTKQLIAEPHGIELLCVGVTGCGPRCEPTCILTQEEGTSQLIGILVGSLSGVDKVKMSLS